MCLRISHTIYYSEPQLNFHTTFWEAASGLYGKMIKKHTIALEVARDFDKIAAAEAQKALTKAEIAAKKEQTVSRLKDLFG